MTTGPRLNGVSGLARFREAWDRDRDRDREKPPADPAEQNATSEQGHINVEGSARCLTSVIYTPASPEFWSAVEPGVRPLVRFLVDALDCITYSSCEGHPPSEDGYPMRGRHVGILPRDRSEHDRLLGLLGAAAAATPAVPGVVEVHVREDDLAGDGEEVLPCIDVLFVAASLDWAAYSANVEAVQRAFLERLTPSGASPASGTAPPPR